MIPATRPYLLHLPEQLHQGDLAFKHLNQLGTFSFKSPFHLISLLHGRHESEKFNSSIQFWQSLNLVQPLPSGLRVQFLVTTITSGTSDLSTGSPCYLYIYPAWLWNWVFLQLPPSNTIIWQNDSHDSESHFIYYLYYELYPYKIYIPIWIEYKIFNSETLKQKRHTVQGQRIGVLIPRQLLIHCLFLYSSFLWFEIFHPGGRFVRTQEVNKTYKIQEVSN